MPGFFSSLLDAKVTPTDIGPLYLCSLGNVQGVPRLYQTLPDLVGLGSQKSFYHFQQLVVK